MASSEPGTRRVRLGKYEILAHVATGGMGAVYKARDMELGREVALKVLLPETAAKPHMLERFRREARSAAKLRHENIVTLYEFGENHGTFYLALEFVEGIDLHDYITKKGKLAVADALEIMTQAGRALAHAHRQGIVHRDIKPSNFLIAHKDGRMVIKLTDFGLAREAGDADFRVTKDGSTVGTVDYLAPEQARDSSSADIRSDLYALGCTAYHMVTGQGPFSEGTLTERVLKHISEPAGDVRRLNPDVGPGLAAVLQRLLNKDPADRYQTPDSLLADLEVLSRSGDRPDSRPALLAEEPGLIPLDEETPSKNGRPPPADTVHNEPILEKQEPEPKPASSTTKSVPRKRATAKPPSAPRVPARPTPVPQAESPRTPPPRRAPASSASVQSTARRLERMADGPLAPPVPLPVKKYSLPTWWPLGAAGGLGLLIALVVIAVMARSDNPTDTPHPDESPRQVDNGHQKKQESSVVSADVPIIPTQPGTTGLPRLFEPRPPIDIARLRTEIEGPFAEAVPEVADLTLRVGRAGGTTAASFRSLAEACAMVPTGKTALIEIHDNGPLFEADLPILKDKNLWIRGAAGFRPIISWDLAGERKARPFWLSLENGRLRLEKLNFVCKWGEAGSLGPATLFELTNGQFHASDCVFSVAGKHPRGLSLLRLQGDRPSQCEWTRCHGRGTDLTFVNLQGPGAEVMIRDSLLVSGDRPLIESASRGKEPATVRVLRSTLAGCKTLLWLHPADDPVPPLYWIGCDSLLAQSDARADGDLILAEKGVVKWRAVNCVYAGWKNLRGGSQMISATSPDALSRLGEEPEAQRVLLATWPVGPRTDPAEVPAVAFRTVGTPAGFAALTGTTGQALGSDVTRLPESRTTWLSLTYDPYTLAPPSPPSGDAPPIVTDEDGLYHGEVIDLDKVADLGLYLRRKLQPHNPQGMQPAARVMLHLAGKGEKQTSPIHFKGVHLVLYGVPPPEEQMEGVSLTARLDTIGDRPALIEVTDGTLEIINLPIRLAGGNLTPVSHHLLRVHGGDLRLFGCRLQGPLGYKTEPYEGLIRFEGSGKEALRDAFSCAIEQCVMQSGKTVLKVARTGAKLLIKRSVLLATEDALAFEPGEPSMTREGTLRVQCLLENNTVAVRRAAFFLGDFPAVGMREPLAIHAVANAFLAPFGESPGQARIITGSARTLEGGGWLWQGRGNAFDAKHLGGLASPDDPTAGGPFARWQRAVGSAGEQRPILLDLTRNKQTTVSLVRPELERLALPLALRKQLGPDRDLPGADLEQLGIISKTK
jgi:eukaryotic-like serine/threonine-protein kinase